MQILVVWLLASNLALRFQFRFWAENSLGNRNASATYKKVQQPTVCSKGETRSTVLLLGLRRDRAGAPSSLLSSLCLSAPVSSPAHQGRRSDHWHRSVPTGTPEGSKYSHCVLFLG